MEQALHTWMHVIMRIYVDIYEIKKGMDKYLYIYV